MKEGDDGTQYRDSKPTIQNKSGGGMRDNKDPPKASHSH